MAVCCRQSVHAPILVLVEGNHRISLRLVGASMAPHVGVLEEEMVLEIERERSGDAERRAASVPDCSAHFREGECVSLIVDESQNGEYEFWWKVRDVCFHCDERVLSHLYGRSDGAMRGPCGECFSLLSDT